MATEVQNSTEPSTTSLVSGIIDDMQDLVKQQVQLTRKEITEEIHKASQAAQFFALGAAILFFGAFTLCLALVYLLHWAASPAAPAAGSDAAKIPLWVCYAIVGGPLAVIGGYLTWLGRAKLETIHPLQNPATEALKDNVKWATNTK
jgi:hypothetical protein